MEPVNTILPSAPPFLSSSSKVPSIKSHNPYFPSELLDGLQRAMFAPGCGRVQLNESECFEGTNWICLSIHHHKNIFCSAYNCAHILHPSPINSKFKDFYHYKQCQMLRAIKRKQIPSAQQVLRYINSWSCKVLLMSQIMSHAIINA